MAAPADPCGAPLIKGYLYLTRGKINIGCKTVPFALMVLITVTSSPRSADETAPICFMPFSETTFLGF